MIFKILKVILRVMLFASCFLVVACSTFYTISDTTHKQYVIPKQIESNFDLGGRFFIQSAKGSQYGNFTWYRGVGDEELNFRTPIGQVVAKIVIINDLATLYIGDKKYSGADLSELMVNNLGFYIPMGYLHYWVQGVALPNIQVEQLSSYGFSQLGWKVEYLDWYNNDRPKIIKISNQQTVIKLFVVWNDTHN